MAKSKPHMHACMPALLLHVFISFTAAMESANSPDSKGETDTEIRLKEEKKSWKMNVCLLC